MALKPCRECKKKVSTESKLCIHCGCPEPDNETFLMNKHNSQLSVKLYKFFDSHLLYSFVDFCGWFFLVCILFLVSNFEKTLWGLNNEKYFVLAGAICGSIYATSYIWIKKYWMKQEDKEDWPVYVFLGIIIFTFTLIVLGNLLILI
ncbi:hypothetical protein PQZ72_01320 [Candidatus Pelagibacter sp.]|jgi:hypothetical protein|nr:hypothetical protein [Candidatus Pelagibacter sp.]|tara:strand:+ start:118 stop:558 length:441 start_codon:yes stop_codon:yes gene_type:complete